jgi:ESS family glutamate:Na+ symporter
MTCSAWVSVLLAMPVLLLGEWLVRKVKLFSRFNLPAPVIGGLLVSLLVLAGNLTGWWPLRFETTVSERWWTWLVSTGPEWATAPSKGVHLPFLVGFFTCIGLNASWDLVRRGSVQVVLFLAVAGVLAVVQNGVGIALAMAMGVSPLLGLVCGSVSMTGGHGTALGFAAEFEKAGLAVAPVLGLAAATFGLVAGGLLGGPVGGWLIRRRNLRSSARAEVHLEAGVAGFSGVLSDLRATAGFGWQTLLHIGVLLACIKVGAWVSFFIQKTEVAFPVYVGAMLVGVGVRNALDAVGRRWIKTEVVDTLAAVLLGLFLSIAMMSLNLVELANTAVPMMVVLLVQIAVVAAFTRYVTFRVMGRDYDAAVMVAGHCGFGLGATPNAIANMKALVEAFGPAPRAFLVLPIVGAFLIDLVNALNITFFLNLLKP